MYFVVAMMADVDPMYQYSLKYFSQVPQEKAIACPAECLMQSFDLFLTLSVVQSVHREQ